MQDQSELADEVRAVMAATFGIDESDVPDDASQEKCDHWCSLSHVTLLIALEEQFGTTFSMEEMSSMTSLPKIVSVLQQHEAVAA